MDRKATRLDWSAVKAGITNFANSLNIENHSVGFIHFALSHILKIDRDEAISCITDGGDDCGIDAVYIDTNSAKPTIHLFQMKFVSEFSKTSSEFPSNSIDKISTFLDACLTASDLMQETCNPTLWIKVQNIRAALEEKVHEFHIHLCSNASKLQDRHYRRLTQITKPLEKVHISEHDLLWFASSLSKNTTKDLTYKLPLVQQQNFGRTDGLVQGLIATVRANDLMEMIQDKNYPTEVDASFFEENIRMFLGEQNEVNRNIVATASSNNNYEFWYLNNGITIVCQNLDYQPKSPWIKAAMRNPQIVNGGQTSYSLFETWRSSPEKINDVELLVRIIETEDPTIANRIAEATNSQSQIRSRDIRSNDRRQLLIESSLVPHGYYYERKNDQHIHKNDAFRIDAAKLGQIILAYILKEPDKAKTSSQKIFGEFYDLVFDESNLDTDRILSIWRIYKFIESEKRVRIQSLNNKIDVNKDEIWIIEGVYHILFMLNLNAEARGVDIYDYEAVIAGYDDVKSLMSNYFKQNRGTAAYRLFRSSDTKAKLARFASPNQLSFGF
jgi:hypothetical protein